MSPPLVPLTTLPLASIPKFVTDVVPPIVPILSVPLITVLPLTSNASVGEVFPIPTLPPVSFNNKLLPVVKSLALIVIS